jgi:chromate transporter
MTLVLQLNWSDWFQMFVHFMSLSLLAVGGAITTAPDMHRFLVDQQGWLSDGQFNASIAIAQAAPGPNVLFIALLGWNVGLNAGDMGTAFWGVFVSMLGIMLPSSTLTYFSALVVWRTRLHLLWLLAAGGLLGWFGLV